jgi:hypothetical protein
MLKPTHTNLYLYQKSHHHPANKHSVLSSLVHRAKALCDQESLASELTFLTKVFQQNGYSRQQIRAMKLATRTNKTENKPTSRAYLPYTHNTYGTISRMLAKYNIKSVAIPPRKISSYMPPTKDAPGLRTPGTGSPVNVARCTSDRADGPSSSALENIVHTSDWSNLANQQLLNTASIMIISSNYKTLNSSLQRPVTCIVSSEKPSKLRCILTISRGMGDSASANPGNYCYIDSRKGDSH